MSRTLALDIASVTGWAVGSIGGGLIGHGVIRMPKTGEQLGPFLAYYHDTLNGVLARYGVPGFDIVYEMPILPADTQLMTVRKLNGLCGMTEFVAYNNGLDIREANLTDIRKHFIGTTRAPKEIEKTRRRQWMKAKTLAECASRGYPGLTDDEGDAIALLSFALSLKDPKFELRATPRAA